MDSVAALDPGAYLRFYLPSLYTYSSKLAGIDLRRLTSSKGLLQGKETQFSLCDGSPHRMQENPHWHWGNWLELDP